MAREYRTLKALRAGETIDIEGIKLKMDDGEIQAGDLYVAERNTGPKLLAAREVVRDTSLVGGYIHPTSVDYSFDLFECVKVCEA